MRLDIQLFGALPARRVSKTRKRMRRRFLNGKRKPKRHGVECLMVAS